MDKLKIGIIGTGWLGLPLAKNLRIQGHTVIGTTTSSSKLALLKKEGIQPLIFNIENPILDQQLQDIDLLLYLVPPGMRHKGIEYFISNIKGFLKSSIPLGSNLKTIYISSTGVYPNQLGIQTENTTIRPDSPTSSALLQAEQLFQNQLTNTSIIRMGGLFGPRRHPAKFFKDVPVLQNPNAPVNMIHQKDCIGLIEAVIEQKMYGKIINGVAPIAPTRKEFYTEAFKSLHLKQPSFGIENSKNKHIVSAQIGNEFNYTFTFANPIDGLQHC